MSITQNPRSPRFASALALVCITLALPIAVGGVWLLTLGGSPYYLVAAAGLLATGLLLHGRHPAALSVFGLLLLGSAVWGVWEAGLDWWPLAARLDLLFVVGLLLLLPWTLRALDTPANRASPSRGSGLVLSAAMLITAVVGVAASLRDPQAIDGALPVSQGTLIAQGVLVRGVPSGDWYAYGRTGYGQRYSPLDQITAANVGRLEQAWQFHTGDLRGQPGDPVETTFEVTPLKIGNSLVLCTPHQAVIALDATSGQQLWRFDAKVSDKLALQHLTCRGLGYQPPAQRGTDRGERAAGATALPAPTPAGLPAPPAPPAPPVAAAVGATPMVDCASKLFMPTADGRLIALDPATGTRCLKFGGGSGQIDLWRNMPNVRAGAYYATSPPVVTRSLVIVGGTVLDNASTHEQSGVIRAYDVDTGALMWNWDSGNPEATEPIAAGQTYTVNSPNSWSISSVDEALGLVYLPLGNQPPDQWGGHRSAAVERFSSSVVALDLATGRLRWVYQTVHHDLWDYDVPSQPSLVDLMIGGVQVPALVQPTKQGDVFVLDRRTGKPLLPVDAVAAPQGAAQGDFTAPTQPKSALSFDPPPLRERDMWGATLLDQLWCRVAFHRLRYDGRFTPPSTGGSLIYPGNFGVFNWGGIAIDPHRQIAFTTPARLAFVSRLLPRPDDSALVINKDDPPKGSLPALNENFGAPFAVDLHPFTSPLGIPCQEPPWGLVAGADLKTGNVAWQHRNGTVRDLSPLPLPLRMGVPSLGGPIVTAGGMAFLSGTLDYFVRGYDVSTGHELWKSRLPAGGQATPMTYLGVDGRQYLLVVAGGHGSTGTKAGDAVIAYALPAAP